MAGHLVTRGVVLRETDTKEADKILTLLTEERGKVSVIARGVRRKGCRYAACAQPLAWSEWTLYQRGTWYYADAGNTLELFQGLRNRLDALALGFYCAELAEAGAVEELPSPALLRHLLNGLYALSALGKSPALVKPAYELKFLSVAGFEPLLDACAVCGNPHPAEPYLDLRQGVLRCRTCGQGGEPLDPDALAAARHILYGEERRLYAFRLGEASLQRLTAASEAFLTVQLDRTFRTLDFYKSLGNPSFHS